MRYLKYPLIIVASLLLTLSTLSLLNPTMVVDNQVYIERETPYVMAAFLDPESMVKWSPIKDIRHVEGLPLMKGSKDLMIFDANGEEVKVVSEVLEFKAYETLTLKYQNHQFSGIISLDFHSDDKNGTLLTIHNEIKLTNFLLRGLGSFFESTVSQLTAESFEGFKKVAEK